MNKPSSYGTGVIGTVGTAGQTVATTKYSVGTSFYNRYGDRYAAIIVKSTQAYTLYVYGAQSLTSFASVADTGSASGVLLDTISGAAATSLDGSTHYIRIAGFQQVLPVLYQASGSNSTVTLGYQTFND